MSLSVGMHQTHEEDGSNSPFQTFLLLGFLAPPYHPALIAVSPGWPRLD